MRPDLLIPSFLAALTLSLSTALHVSMAQWENGRRGDEGVLARFLGESRRMFATHYFIKADAYFHSGYYPSIFDTQDPNAQAHIAEHAAGIAEDEEEEKKHDFDGPPRDWIDRFGRAFRPNKHRHLDDMEDEHEEEHGGHAHHEHHDGGADRVHEAGHDGEGAQAEKTLGTVDAKGSTPTLTREILPWLRLSASLDPQRVQTYVVGAYYLRNMGHPEQAESFLREGFRENPKSYEILTELGKLCLENRKDANTARNLWAGALRYWREQQAEKPEDQRDRLTQATLLANLAKVEENAGNDAKAAQYLAELIEISPNKAALIPRLEAARQRAAQALQPRSF